jgi:hypothetical protein
MATTVPGTGVKKFGGVLYSAYDIGFSKTMAEKTAHALRADGFLVRIVRENNSYTIYRRHGRDRRYRG